jgi:hypothetical protein
MLFRGVCVALTLLVACVSARASELLFRKDSLFVFGGVFSSGNMGQSINPFYQHESNFILGAAYSRDFVDLGWNVVFGGELGLAGRLGDRSSAEVWAGPTFRHQGIPFGNIVTLTPGFTVGLSAVTAPIGIERAREIEHDGNSTLLFYLAPELGFRFDNWPNTEIVYRLHHRSGLLGTLGKMHEGANAHVLGVRWRL